MPPPNLTTDSRVRSTDRMRRSRLREAVVCRFNAVPQPSIAAEHALRGYFKTSQSTPASHLDPSALRSRSAPPWQREPSPSHES